MIDLPIELPQLCGSQGKEPIMKQYGICCGIALAAMACAALLTPYVNGAAELTGAEMRSMRGWACQACQAKWVSLPTELTLAGGIECGHGPENDVDCDTSKSNWSVQCWELNGHKNNPDDPNATTGDGKCMCFACGIQAGCEVEIQIWRAWCGAETKTNCGSCDEELDTANQPIRQERAAIVVGGGACNFGTNGFGTQYECGRHGKYAFACASSNCTGQGNWTTVQLGNKMKCK